MRKYTNVALPDDLVATMDKVIKKGGLGYKSRGEFTKEAVRLLLRSNKENEKR